MYLRLFLMARDVERLKGEPEGFPYPHIERTLSGLAACRQRAYLTRSRTLHARYSSLLHRYAAEHANERAEQRGWIEKNNARVREASNDKLAAREGGA